MGFQIYATTEAHNASQIQPDQDHIITSRTSVLSPNMRFVKHKALGKNRKVSDQNSNHKLIFPSSWQIWTSMQHGDRERQKRKKWNGEESIITMCVAQTGLFVAEWMPDTFDEPKQIGSHFCQLNCVELRRLPLNERGNEFARCLWWERERERLKGLCFLSVFICPVGCLKLKRK